MNTAVQLGIMVLSAYPVESEVPLEFAGLADLLETVPAVLVDGLPDPQRQAVRQAVLRTEPRQRPRIREPRRQLCLRCFAAWPGCTRWWSSSMTWRGLIPPPPARCRSRCAACGLSPWACWRRCGRTGRESCLRWPPTVSQRKESIACGSGRSASGRSGSCWPPGQRCLLAGRFCCASTRHRGGILCSRWSWPRGRTPRPAGSARHARCA